MARNQHRTSDILEAVALLVVDMQESFLRTIPDGDDVTRRCAFAIETAHTLGLEVIFTEQVPEKLGHTHPALASLAEKSRTYSKNTFSALQAQGLIEHLRRAGIYHLLIAGIEAPVCIYQTALHAQDSDFDVTVLSDCVSGRRGDDCRVVLQGLAGASCHVLPSETVFYSMLGNSTHPLFSDYTSLVKKYGDPALDLSSDSEKKPSRGKSQAKGKGRTKAATKSESVSDEAPEHEDVESRASETPKPEQASADTDAPKKRTRRRRGGARRRKARPAESADGSGTSDAEAHSDSGDTSGGSGSVEPSPQSAEPGT